MFCFCTICTCYSIVLNIKIINKALFGVLLQTIYMHVYKYVQTIKESTVTCTMTV